MPFNAALPSLLENYGNDGTPRGSYFTSMRCSRGLDMNIGPLSLYILMQQWGSVYVLNRLHRLEGQLLLALGGYSVD